MRGSRGLMSGVGGRLRDGMFRVWSVDLDASVGVVAGLGRLALACHSDIWLRVLDHAVDLPVSISTLACSIVHRSYRTHKPVQVNESLIRQVGLVEGKDNFVNASAGEMDWGIQREMKN